jgi:hypothetical protein
MFELPNDRPLTDAEIAIAVSQAILNDRQNPGSNLPLQATATELLARLGIPDRSTPDPQAWRQRFFKVNPRQDLDFRLAEYCWRLVGLGFLVPQLAGEWGAFHLTKRGRAFFQGFDSSALTEGGLDARLGDIGFSPTDLPRQYARLGHECFFAGHYEASTVMLGVATEALVLGLADALAAVQRSFAPTLRARAGRSTAAQTLSWLIEAVESHRGELQTAARTKGVSQDWIEQLRSLLPGTGQAIRLTRNDVGHPTGISVSQEDALQLFVLFPRLAKACTEAIAALT